MVLSLTVSRTVIMTVVVIGVRVIRAVMLAIVMLLEMDVVMPSNGLGEAPIVRCKLSPARRDISVATLFMDVSATAIRLLDVFVYSVLTVVLVIGWTIAERVLYAELTHGTPLVIILTVASMFMTMRMLACRKFVGTFLMFVNWFSMLSMNIAV